MLDIIVTHWNEPWSECRKFFDMLGCQRGVNFADFRVILVHDGAEKFPDKNFSRYPYRVDQCRIEHAGVSAARNYGLGLATDKWVEFCDCDDMYANAYGMREVMSVMDREADYMWTPFLVECKTKDGFGLREQGQNLVWIHGKYFNREFLIRNNIRFPEGIHYSEDSAFCAVVNELAGKSGKIKTTYPVYLWTYREDSVSVDKRNAEKNLTGFIDRNVWVVEEYKRRGIPHTLMVARMFADAYWAFHQKKRKFPEQEARFLDIAKGYYGDLARSTDKEKDDVLEAAYGAFKGIEMDAAPTFREWIQDIQKAGERE